MGALGVAGHVARDVGRAALYQQRLNVREQQVAAQAQATRGGGVAVRAEHAVVVSREPVDGDETLRYVYTFLKRFAVWGSDAEIVTATLWIAHTHARDARDMPIWQYCARLGIFGPSGSGKSWKSRLVGKLAYKGEILVEPTKASFIDFCADHNTVIVTEADEAFRSPGRSRSILAVINASYEPDRSTSRKQGGVKVKIPLFTHIVLDGIDTLLSAARPDLKTMISRCIVILSQQAPEGYRPPRFDAKARMIAEQLGQRASAWMAQEVEDGMAEDEPYVPEQLGNRPFGKWEPLFIVAGRADAAWRGKQEGDVPEGEPGPWSAALAAACDQLELGPGLAEQPEEVKSELDRVMAEWGDG